jgi:hypothetical protein
MYECKGELDWFGLAEMGLKESLEREAVVGRFHMRPLSSKTKYIRGRDV